MANTNINKMSKEALVKFLDENFKEVKEKQLRDMITYTANAWKKNPDSVKISDLRPLAKEVQALLDKKSEKTVASATPAPANSVKKPTLKGKKTVVKKEEPQEEPDEEEVEEPVEEKEEKKPVKKAAKTSSKTTKAKAEEKKKPVKLVQVPDVADAYDETVETEIGTMTKAADIQTFDDLYNAVENGEDIYLAMLWTKRLLAQFTYNQCAPTVPYPKEFPNDLDFSQIVYMDEEKRLLIAVSSYTSNPYILIPQDIPYNKKTGTRNSAGLDFEIYRLTEEATSEEEGEDEEE